MKILSISFKNINNLKGENTISFCDEPLDSAGIFAITGPTGSGKSTILDVITLALFNRIPRFKKSISKSEIEGLGSVITHHTEDARASITYNIKGDIFTSEWTVSRTRTGNLKDYEMFIYDASGTPLDLKKSEVPTRNEELIGLKYEQFVKSIILSQGQFSKFLKADKNERGQLLENLTGSSIYRKLGIAAYERAKTVKNEVSIEKDRLENIITLSDEERQALQNNITEGNQRKDELDINIKLISSVKVIKTEITKSSEELSKKKERKIEIAKEESDFRDQLKKLETYDKLSPLRGELTRYQDAVGVGVKLKADIRNNEEYLKGTQVKLQESLEGMSLLTGVDVNPENFNTIMSAFEKEINSLDQKIRFVISKGQEARNKINTKADKGNVPIGHITKPSEAILELKRLASIYQAILSNAKISEDADSVELRAAIRMSQQSLSKLESIDHLYEHEKLLTDKANALQKQLVEYQSEIDKVQPVIVTIEKLIVSQSQNVELLKKAKHDASLIANLTEQRNSLVEGDPCPLCGAVHHPYSEHSPDHQSDIDNQIAKAISDLEGQQEELRSHNTGLTRSKTSYELSKKQLESNLKEGKRLEEEKSKAISSFSGNHPIGKDKIRASIEALKTEIELKSDGVDALNSTRILVELLEDYNEFERILEEHKSLKILRESKYKGKNVSAECNALQDSFAGTSKQINTVDTLLGNAKTTLIEIQETEKRLFGKLTPKLKSIGFNAIEDAIGYLISDDELTMLKEKKEQLTKLKTAIDTEVRTLEKSIFALKEQDVQRDKSLDNISTELISLEEERDGHVKSIGENSAKLKKDDEERSRFKSKAEIISKLNLKLEKWDLLNRMIGDAGGNKFANFAQGLTLQNLLVYANRRLQNLSDRYLLDKPVKDGALTVIDQYQGNIHRSVATLSGGESFLISLALALSLSDMASKNISLESLFIDEGFGTLDQETLDIAINTLEKLQSESQKTVGVISHVEALKERIHVQIKLEKNAQGYSDIMVVS